MVDPSFKDQETTRKHLLPFPPSKTWGIWLWTPEAASRKSIGDIKTASARVRGQLPEAWQCPDRFQAAFCALEVLSQLALVLARVKVEAAWGCIVCLYDSLATLCKW